MSGPSQPTLFGAIEGAGTFVQRGVVVRETVCRSLLNRSTGGGYSFNCYTGCALGCRYCYARFMQRFHPHAEAWGQFVDVKTNAAEVLVRQVRRLPAGRVFTCSACDGWQPVESHYELTRRCCRILLDAGFTLNVLTKRALVLRDLDVMAGRDVCVGVTISTADQRMASLWEPGASSVAERAGVLRQAKAAGLRTSVMFGPLLPQISDTPEALRALFDLAAALDVDRIWTDTLNPRPRVWPSVQALVRAQWPGLIEHYRRVLFDGAFRRQYTAELHGRIEAAAAQSGVSQRLA